MGKQPRSWEFLAMKVDEWERTDMPAGDMVRLLRAEVIAQAKEVSRLGKAHQVLASELARMQQRLAAWEKPGSQPLFTTEGHAAGLTDINRG